MAAVKLFNYCVFYQHWYKIPEVGGYTETCKSKLMLKYTIYRVVHSLVQIEFVINLEGTLKKVGS